MIPGLESSLMAFDSSAVWVYLISGISNGFSPPESRAWVSWSKQSGFLLKISVAEIASGLSI